MKEDYEEQTQAEAEDEFMKEAAKRRKIYDYKTDKFLDEDVGDKEEIGSEDEEKEEGDEWLANIPFKGQMQAPTNMLKPVSKEPDEFYNIEYAYGYRCEDVRQNAFLSDTKKVVYMTAALGVVLDPNKNTQKFFGGSTISAKNPQNSNLEHNDDIISLAISTDRKYCATGQIAEKGLPPSIFIWDTKECKMKNSKSSTILPKGSRGVTAVSFSTDGNYIACSDLHDKHRVYVYGVNDLSKPLLNQEGGPDRINGISWNRKTGQNTFMTAGIKHIKYWLPFEKGKNSQIGIYGSTQKTNFGCVTSDQNGSFYSGGANGMIYKWNGNKAIKAYPSHKGPIHAINCCDNSLFSGASDMIIKIFNIKDMKLMKSIQVDATPRSVDCYCGILLAGLQNGSIYTMNEDGKNKKEIMASHNQGETWGLDVDKGTNFIVTTGDDNQIIVWNSKNRKKEKSIMINQNPGKKVKYGASTLSTLPDNQCSRCVCINHEGQLKNFAVATNEGKIQIRDSLKNPSQLKVLTDPHRWVECLTYSPDGNKLAVGAHDQSIYIYDVKSGYKLYCELTGHSSFITSLDWSSNSSYLRSNSGDYEIRYFNIESKSADPSGRSSTVDLDWATQNNKLGWIVKGIYPKGRDGTHVRGVCISNSKKLIASGDEYFLVNIYRNPILDNHQCKSFKGHCSFVTRVAFGDNDDLLFSVGGFDKTLIQRRKGMNNIANSSPTKNNQNEEDNE